MGTATCPDYLTEAWLFDFLEKRKDFLDGVVISGGEPTLQKDLIPFCKEIKTLGYSIKIDTNGSQPEIIKHLIDTSMVDYIAMDIKTAPDTYTPVIAEAIDPGVIESSIQTLMDACIAYEFRTTCVKPVVNQEVIERIVKRIPGAETYYLQRAQNKQVLDSDFFNDNDDQYTEIELLQFQTIAAQWVKRCIIR
jgi:pyruvate formate lyase activating enzyme